MKSQQQLTSVFSILLIAALLAACGSPAAAPTTTPVPPTLVVETEANTMPQAAMAPEPIGLRPDAPPYAVHGPYWVGYKSVVIGEGTDHPLQAGLWYPALNPAGDKEEITYAMPWKIPSMPLDTESVAYGHALRDAAVDDSAAPYPLVVFSPGFGTAAPWYSNLIEHYASYGFVVLAPEHIEQWDPEVRDKWRTSIDRPLDVKRTLDFAEQATAAGGDMAGLIDMQHVAVEGHSYGGYTAMAVAGAQFDLDGFNARCAQLPPDDPKTFFCAPLVSKEADMAVRSGLDPMPEGLWPSVGDPRVTAIIPIAGDSYLFDKAGLSKITIPMMAIGGTADTGTPYDWGSKLAYDNASSAKKVLVTLEGAEHTITTSCENLPWMYDTPFGGWICFDPVWDKDRGMDLINHFSTAFLLDTLKGDTEAAMALAPENVSFPDIQYETTSYGVAQNAAVEAKEELHGLRPDAPTYAVHGPYAVGTRDFTLETAGRTVPLTVWYPAVSSASEPEEITYSMDIGDGGMMPFPVHGNAILGAQPDNADAPYPLVVYSHGLFLYRQTAAYLAEHLASQGFVVIAGNHEDNWGTFGQPWDASYVSRPKDVTAWIDFAETLNAQGGDLEGLIDSEQVGITGHSFGGYTALSAAGARFDPNWFFDVLCPAGPLAPDDMLNECGWLRDKLPAMATQAGLDAAPEGLWPSWGDPRVDAIAITSPATRFGPDGNASVSVPALLLSGSGDRIIDVNLNVHDTYETLGSSDKTKVILENGGHALFINDCATATGMTAVAYIYCSDPVWDMDRVHDLTNHFMTAFMLAELKGDSEAAKALAPENVTFPGIDYQTTEFGATPAAQLDEAMVTKIDDIVHKAMMEYPVPGMTMCILKDSDLVYSKGFGIADVESKRPMTPASVSTEYSISKSVTALAVMGLVEQGKIDLDKPVTDYLPYFAMADPRYKDITVRMLLSHTSGMVDSPAIWEDPLDPAMNPLEQAARSLSDQTLLFAPGEGWNYSGWGYSALGDIIAKVTGQPFEDYMQQNWLTPLGMANSTFIPDEVDPGLRVAGYFTSSGSSISAGSECTDPRDAPACTLWSSCEDMAKLAQLLLNKGELDGTRYLQPETIDTMWTSAADTHNLEALGPQYGPPFAEYGIGWYLGEKGGHQLAGHAGGATGYNTQLQLAPDDGWAVIAMDNWLNPEPDWYPASFAAIDVLYELLGIEPE